MKINIISKTLAALFVLYGSNCLAAAQSGELTRPAKSGVLANRVTKNARTQAMTLQRGQPIVKTPEESRDTSGETMYALPYEEEVTEVAPVSKTPFGRGMIGEPIRALPVEEPADTRRPGMMYAL